MTGALTLDFQTAFNAAMAICGTTGIPILNNLLGRIKEARDAATVSQARAEAVERELNAHKLYVAENLMRNEHFERFEEKLFRELDSIKKSLDGKVDK